jgi:hypothetical protein
MNIYARIVWCTHNHRCCFVTKVIGCLQADSPYNDGIWRLTPASLWNIPFQAQGYLLTGEVILLSCNSATLSNSRIFQLHL